MALGLNILKIKVKFLLAFVGAERSPEPRCAHNLLFKWDFSLLCLHSAIEAPRLHTPEPFANTSRTFSMSRALCGGKSSPSGKESTHSSG